MGGRPGAEYEVLRVEGVESGDEIRVDPEISFNKVNENTDFTIIIIHSHFNDGLNIFDIQYIKNTNDQNCAAKSII